VLTKENKMPVELCAAFPPWRLKSAAFFSFIPCTTGYIYRYKRKSVQAVSTYLRTTCKEQHYTVFLLVIEPPILKKVKSQ